MYSLTTYIVISRHRIDIYVSQCPLYKRGHHGWCNGLQARLTTFPGEFNSYRMPHSCGLVRHLSEKLSKLVHYKKKK